MFPEIFNLHKLPNNSSCSLVPPDQVLGLFITDGTRVLMLGDAEHPCSLSPISLAMPNGSYELEISLLEKIIFFLSKEDPRILHIFQDPVNLNPLLNAILYLSIVTVTEQAFDNAFESLTARLKQEHSEVSCSVIMRSKVDLLKNTNIYLLLAYKL